MSDQSTGTPASNEYYVPLAKWLYQLLQTTPLPPAVEQRPEGDEIRASGSVYHADYYPQIPNFALALLKQDAEAPIHYAPLLFHLLGCPSCHQAYLETYDALRAAFDKKSRPPSFAGFHSSITLSTTSPRLLVFLCQLLVGHAGNLLHQRSREPDEQVASARAFLQQAIQLSRFIMQGTLRQRALRDLVTVASLAIVAPADDAPGTTELSYAAQVSGGSGSRGRTLRRADMIARSEEQGVIELRSGSLEGRVTQEEDMLVLHLVGLDEHLHGKFLVISVLLGTLLEPIRWLGGNPYAIRSAEAVRADGTLSTPVGRTDLLLKNPEDRNLAETLFKKLDIRSA